MLAGGAGGVLLVAGGGGGAVVGCWLGGEAVLVPRLEGEERRSAMMKFAAQQGFLGAVQMLHQHTYYYDLLYQR